MRRRHACICIQHCSRAAEVLRFNEGEVPMNSVPSGSVIPECGASRRDPDIGPDGGEWMREHLPIAGQTAVPRLMQLSRIQSGLHSTGGLLREDAVAAALFCSASDARWLLNRWIPGRRVLALTWLGRRLLPAFQFDFGAASVRTPASQVLSEFESVFDDWESAQWFATPNLWLGGRPPAEMVLDDPQAVLGAARADRYIAIGTP